MQASVTVFVLSTVPPQSLGLLADPESPTIIAEKLLLPGMTPSSLITHSLSFKVQWLRDSETFIAEEVVGKMGKKSSRKRESVRPLSFSFLCFLGDSRAFCITFKWLPGKQSKREEKGYMDTG